MWRKIPNVKPFAGAVAVKVTAGGPGLVAVGSGLTGKAGTIRTGKLFAVVWTSHDGVTWRRVPYSQITFGGAEMFDVAGGDFGLVAVGHNTQGEEHSVVWTSRDGVHWRRLSNARTTFGPRVVTFRVLAGPHGRLLAIGVDQNTINESRAWTSTDGMHWQPAPAGAFQQGTVTNVSAAGPGFLAVGTQESDPALWSSPDGLHWQHEAGPEIFTGRHTDVYDVTRFGHRLTVAGIRGARTPSSGQATTWLWSPGQTQGTPQPASHPNLSDPKTFRLRLADIPSDYHIQVLDYEPVCRADGSNPRDACVLLRRAIRPYRAFITRFTVNAPTMPSIRVIHGVTIVTPSRTTARRALQRSSPVVDPYFATANRLPLHLQIGEESRLYATHEIVSPTSPRGAFAVIWRDGRFVGSVTVAGEPKVQAIADAIRYAQQLHAHLKAAR